MTHASSRRPAAFVVQVRSATRAKKGRSRVQAAKSREETPKEGGGNATSRIAALQQYATAPHKRQVWLT
jgi:hypothetical protein